MRFIHLLIINLKLEVFSWICLKASIKSGMKALYLKISKTVFDLLKIPFDFLRNRKQRVTLNGQSFSWTNVSAWVPKDPS